MFYGTTDAETRTPDLFRVNLEVLNLKPFAHLVFRALLHEECAKTTQF